MILQSRNRNSPRTPSERILALDVGRGLSVFFMVMVHALWMFGNTETQSNSAVGIILHFLGKGTAAFLVLMGFSLALSRNTQPKGLFLRGVSLLVLAFIMNGLKFLVPIMLFKTMPIEFIKAYGWHSPLDWSQLSYLLLTGDILQMAGLALILLSAVYCFKPNKIFFLILAFSVCLLSREVSGLFTDTDFGYLLKLFWGNDYQVYFPIFPWFACILIGLFFGFWFKEKQASVKTSGALDKIFILKLQFGIGMVVIGGGLIWYEPSYHFNNFFHLGPGGAIYLTGLNLVGLWIIHNLLKRVHFPRIERALQFMSQRVTSLYIIQWTLICWGMGLVGFQTLNSAQVLMTIPFVFISTFLVQWCLDKVLLTIKNNYSLRFTKNKAAVSVST